MDCHAVEPTSHITTGRSGDAAERRMTVKKNTNKAR